MLASHGHFQCLRLIRAILQRTHERLGVSARQVGTLAGGLLATAPTTVSEQVNAMKRVTIEYHTHDAYLGVKNMLPACPALENARASFDMARPMSCTIDRLNDAATPMICGKDVANGVLPSKLTPGLTPRPWRASDQYSYCGIYIVMIVYVMLCCALLLLTPSRPMPGATLVANCSDFSSKVRRPTRS